jgi:hypothetical protein
MKILLMTAHPDDADIMAGGTMRGGSMKARTFTPCSSPVATRDMTTLP